MDFRSLPKVELHLHLDCSLSYEVVSELDPAVTRQQFEQQFIAPAKCADLPDFLSRARQGIALMQTEEGLRRVTADLVRQLRDDNVVYAEIRFAPLLHTEEQLTPDAVVETVRDAVRTARTEADIDIGVILCTLRHFSSDQSLTTARLVDHFRGDVVTALDIAGDEGGFPLDPHVPAYEYAFSRDIPRTAHAGEALGSESVRETLVRLRPSRVGHGVRSIEDSRLLSHLRKNHIHLEICPSCNVQVNVVPTLEDHPIDRLYRQGVSVGVNTDARTITHVTLSDEYERLHRTFGWERTDFLACNLRAAEAAFAGDGVRKRIKERLTDGYHHA